MTILELFRWVRSSQGFHTLESSRCSDSNEEHRAPVVDCTQVPFGNAAAGKRVPIAELMSCFVQEWSPSSHSYLNATIGSTRIARRAGSIAAIAAMRSIKQIENPTLSGSVSFTPQVAPRIICAAGTTAPKPRAMPMQTTRIICPITIRNTSPRSAPRAMRMPIWSSISMLPDVPARGRAAECRASPAVSAPPRGSGPPGLKC